MSKALIIFLSFLFPFLASASSYNFITTSYLPDYDGYDWWLAGTGGDAGVICQAFRTTDGGYLQSFSTYLQKIGSPTAVLNVDLYAHGGTYPSTSVVSGSWISRATLDSSTVPTSMTLVEIPFTFGNYLEPLTNYIICINGGSLVTPDYLRMGVDGNSPAYYGTLLYGSTPANAISYTPNDMIFSVVVSSEDISYYDFMFPMGLIVFFLSLMVLSLILPVFGKYKKLL